MSEQSQPATAGHADQIVAGFENMAGAAAARDALVAHGVDRANIHISSTDAATIEEPNVGNQIMDAVSELMSSSSAETARDTPAGVAHVLLSVALPPGADRQRVLETLERSGALDFDRHAQG